MMPSGPLTQGQDGRLYGNASQGGSNGLGTVYAVSSTGALTVLHNFLGSDGSGPVGALVSGSDGTLYGVTEYGGANDAGTVFSISSSGAFTLLHSFAAWADGANADGMAPRGGLVLGSDGNFYGATTRGGSNDAGTLFRITPAGVLTTLYSFSAFNSTQADGALPATALVSGGDGRFYGSTSTGGKYSSGGLAPGTLFSIGLDGTFSALHSFSATIDGSSPSGLAANSAGGFYGATSSGGSNGNGTIFKATPQGDITTLYTFSASSAISTGLQANSDGAFPVSGILAGNDGTLYGGTVFGGSNGTGTLFSLAPDNTLTVLHEFGGLSNVSNSDGANITSAPMRAKDGNLYGVTTIGGSNGSGVIYKLTMPPLPTITLTLGSGQISSGGSTSLSWSTSNASSCAASGGWSGSLDSSGSTTVSPAGSTTYTVSCRNVSGTSAASKTLTVNSDNGQTGGSNTGGGSNSGSGTGTGTGGGSTGGGGGGGAMPAWLIAWIPLALMRRRKRQSFNPK